MLSMLERNNLLKQIQSFSIEDLNSLSFKVMGHSEENGFELLDTLTNELENRLSEKRRKPTKTLSKLVYTLYVAYDSILKTYNRVSLSQNLYDKILGLKAVYIQNIQSPDDIDIKTLDRLYEKIKHTDSIIFLDANTPENDNKNQEVINNLENQIKKLENKITKYKNKIAVLNKKIKEFDNTINSNNINEINKLKNKITDLESKVSDITFENNRLKQELENAKLLVQNYYINQELRAKSLQLNQEIASLLVKNGYTLRKMRQFLLEEFPNITIDDIYAAIKHIKNHYSLLQNRIQNNEIVYEFGFQNNKIYTLEDSSREIDFIIIADCHITSNMTDIIRNMNYIYNYAINNHIGIIINLGDMFDSNKNIDLTYDNLVSYENMLIKSIKELPKSSGILNLLLGGNHDKDLLKFGIDPINMLCRDRHDYLNLGYYNAILNIRSHLIGLHHPGSTRLHKDNVHKFIMNNDDLISYLDSYYHSQSLDRDSIHLDLLGHFHLSKLNQTNSYLMLPSLNVDKHHNGAWRCKIIFDAEGKIENTILIPLIVESKVIESGTIDYQKIKKYV